jgi:acetyl-CoA hydrolase
MIWTKHFKERTVTPEEAISSIKSGDTVWIHPGCATPELLIRALVDRKDELENVEIAHILTLGDAPYVEPGMEKHFRHRAFFTGANVREAINEGRADFVPIFLSEIPKLFYKGEYKIDVALITVSPPDEYGFCSYGVGIECTKAAAETAKIVIAEVNPNMPRALGDSFIHVSKIHYFVESDRPIPELPKEEITELHKRIAGYIAELIEDGSTLQVGIGGIPDAVLLFMKDKKDLGIHTEMFSDGLLPLIESGVVNNERKTLHRGKVVASFVLGTKKLFEFIDNNPLFEFHPSDYVNDPFIISQNEKMVAINSALQIDLTGQVCSDSIGHRIYSGIGGQVDFIRGAARSKGGKPIIALPSTAKGGKISRIVPTLTEGAGVVTSRGDVHYVITEYGIAYLHGKSVRERAKALIEIAHPDFRDWLKFEARKRCYL